MDHIAIDLGGRESQICVRNDGGTIVEEKRVKTEALGVWLQARPAGRAIVETCSQGFVAVAHAQAAEHEIRVVPATLVRTLGVGARRLKTDRRDAQVLSQVSTRLDLPSVHVPSEQSRERKAICTTRQALVRCRTMLINSVRGWFRVQGRRIRSGNSTTFASRVAEGTDAVPAYVQRTLTVIEELNRQIAEADKELVAIAKADEVCRRLMTVPGVGVLTAVWFACVVDEVERFPDSHSPESYFGLVPGDNSSSDRRRRTGLTKAGNTNVRWTLIQLIQAAWAAWRCRPGDPMVQWAKRIAERRGTKVAIVALARKMAGILFSIWRDKTDYEPTRGAQRIDADGVVHPAHP